MEKPKRISRTIEYQSPWVNLFIDKVCFPNGRIIDRHHLLDFELPSVAVVVDDPRGRILFVRVPRYATGSSEWEIPAGNMEKGESVFTAAKREVIEETGYLSQDLKHLYTYYPMNGISNKVFHVVRCKAVQQFKAPDLSEVQAIRWFTTAEIRDMINNREISDGFTLTALLLRGL
ncbi:NUDIX hydrolase [Chloroflexota bacterium]